MGIHAVDDVDADDVEDVGVELAFDAMTMLDDDDDDDDDDVCGGGEGLDDDDDDGGDGDADSSMTNDSAGFRRDPVFDYRWNDPPPMETQSVPSSPRPTTASNR